MNDASGFTQLVPGFEFLQSLVKNAGAALPGIGQWVAPTLDPAEIEKRIEELRTVQFWLEQNVRMLAATIQALEVQRMTLSTLKTMNVQMDGLRESMQIRMPTATPIVPSTTTPAPAPIAAAQPVPEPAAKPEAAADAAGTTPAAVGAVDPMQWWGALTKQFAELATGAMKDTSGDAARTLAGAMVKQTLDSAGAAVKSVQKAAAAATTGTLKAAATPAPKRKPAPAAPAAPKAAKSATRRR